MGFSDFEDVVAFGNNQLWRPLAAKVQGLHSGLPKNMVSLYIIPDPFVIIVTMWSNEEGYLRLEVFIVSNFLKVTEEPIHGLHVYMSGEDRNPGEMVSICEIK